MRDGAQLVNHRLDLGKAGNPTAHCFHASLLLRRSSRVSSVAPSLTMGYGDLGETFHLKAEKDRTDLSEWFASNLFWLRKRFALQRRIDAPANPL